MDQRRSPTILFFFAFALYLEYIISTLLPKVLILLVLLISWMEDPSWAVQDIQVIEYFAGCSRVAQLSEYLGFKSVPYEIEFDQKSQWRAKRSSMDLNSSAGLVLAVKLILRGRFNELISLFATCCGSFVPVNRGTGSRDLLVPLGNNNVPSVRKSNKLMSRKLAFKD